MSRRLARTVLSQSFSLAVAWFILFSIFAVHVELLGLSAVPWALGTLASAVVLRYVAVHHPFSRRLHRSIAALLPTVALVAVGALTVERFLAEVSIGALQAVFEGAVGRFGAASFLPEWWLAVLLVVAGALLLAGAVRRNSPATYQTPANMGEIPTSPPFFGFLCAFFGLWAVLFVGFRIQRVFFIAPIFEELLKFGVALLVGAALFDRSAAARVGVALVVGALFGVVEHATTYPTEADTVYLFRTVFHAATTVLSVSIYTVFESRHATRLQWIAPVYSILLHFFYNTFVVLSAVISAVAFGGPNTGLALVYGTAAIVLVAGLLVVASVRQRALVAIHRPIEAALAVFV